MKTINEALNEDLNEEISCPWERRFIIAEILIYGVSASPVKASVGSSRGS